MKNILLYLIVAIVIIAIVVLYLNGRSANSNYNSQQTTVNQQTTNQQASSTTCSPAPGSYCASPTFSHLNGELSLIIEQNSGFNYNVANIIFVPQSEQISLPYNGSSSLTIFTPGNYLSIPGGMANGQHIGVQIPVSVPEGAGATVNIGQSYSGFLLVEWQAVPGGRFYYSELATVNLTAT
jgi:hypothetical protein